MNERSVKKSVGSLTKVIFAAAFLGVVFVGLLFSPAGGAEWERRGLQVQATEQPPKGAPAKVLSAEMVLNRRSISGLQLSPDETRVAMVVSQPVKGAEQTRNIWIYDLAGRKLVHLTSSAKSDTRPRFSPHGGTLAFLSDRAGETQVYLIPLDGGEARPLTESKTAVGSFEWSPDGKKIAFSSSPAKTEEEEKKEKEKDDARVIEKEAKNPLLQVIDLDSKAVRILISGAWRFSEYVWTPDSKALAVVASDHPQRELFTDKIYLVDAAEGKMSLLAAPAGPFGNVKVLPDAKSLAYVGSRTDGPATHDLFITPLAGGAAQNLTARSIDRPVGDYFEEGDGRIFLGASEGFTTAFFTLTLDGQAARSTLTPEITAGSYVKGKNVFAFAGETAVDAPELWVAAGGGSSAKVSQFNKDWEAIKLAPLELFTYSSFDGRKIEGALLKPPGWSPGARVPLVTIVHGGPTSAWTNKFDSWGQLLAARGFAVFYPNIRGSTGYGHNFMVLNRWDWGGGDFRDVMAGVDYLIQRGIADPERLGIGGWSYGGYMAAWAVTQTGRFKASVSGAPMTDLALEYGAEEPGINAYDTWFLGTPYENLDRFIDRSPVTHVKKAKTPTLILCGENDSTDPIAQCYQFHRGLRRYGVETEFVAYPREGHGLREEKHRVDMLNRVVAWFEGYLKPGAPHLQ